MGIFKNLIGVSKNVIDYAEFKSVEKIANKFANSMLLTIVKKKEVFKQIELFSLFVYFWLITFWVNFFDFLSTDLN